MNNSPLTWSLRGQPALLMSKETGGDTTLSDTYHTPTEGGTIVVHGIDVSFSDTAVNGTAHYLIGGGGELHYGSFIVDVPPELYYCLQWRGEMALPPNADFKVAGECSLPAAITLVAWGLWVPIQPLINF